MGDIGDVYNLAHKEAMEAAGRGDWANAIQWGKKVPMSWDVWQQFPTAGGDEGTEMPDEVIKQIHSHLSAKDRDRNSGFYHELASNLPKNIKPETLNLLARHGADDYMISDAVHAHPNFQPDVQMKQEEGAANFWNGYERKVHPDQFATIKSLSTNRPENYTFHRDQSKGGYESEQPLPEVGSSDANMAILPHLRNHAAMVQSAVKNDPYLREHHISYQKNEETGQIEPHVRVYRGVQGEYAKSIRNASGYDPNSHTSANKKLKVPSAPFSSWTTDPQVAQLFASPHGVKGNEHGLVMEAHLPLRDLLHSGTHHITPLQVHAHPNEQEMVFQHPSGHYRVKAKDVHFGVPDKENGNFAGYSYKKAKTRKAVKPVGPPKTPANPVEKFELDGNEITLSDLGRVVWGKALQKNINPADIHHLLRQQEPTGPKAVNAKGHETMHPLSLSQDVEGYRKHAIHSENDLSSTVDAPEGMTAKAMFKAPNHGGTFMVKPYHERVIHPNTNLARWNKHPIAGGWAEMANQGIYHAGGIGHLHMKVHTDTYNHGDTVGDRPAIVIHMARGYHPVAHEGHGIDFAGERPEDLKDAKKMQMMDFLGNNLDRHGYNLLRHPEKGLLAIDNGRNFQYVTSSRGSETPNLTDRVANYNGTGNQFSSFSHVDKDQSHKDPKGYEKDWDDAFQWWKEKSPNIRSEFRRHLALVQDPALREHLATNFDTRVAHLDALATHRSPGWQSRTVPITPFKAK